MAHYNSFVVRIWSDDDGNFHGEVVHVATQEKRRFLNLDRMDEFIMEHLGPAEALQEDARQVSQASSSSGGESDGNGDEWPHSA